MKFEKVSRIHYVKTRNIITGKKEYFHIKLPKRATKHSAGYDFFAPFPFTLEPGEEITIPTGIRVLLDPDKFLAIYPRSGMGSKYKVQLANTVGIIDSDYSQSDNEGHIFIKLFNDNRNGQIIDVKQGEAIAQGIIQQYFTTEDDSADGIRNGGFGSTSR